MNSYDTRRNHWISIVVGAAVALAALLGTAAQADAAPIKESTIKSECKSAGGSYSSVNKQGTRFSTCKYKDNEGNGYVDYYADGEYYSTHPA
jgi:curli biogenesis system outer membrane secretion channel CsgG